MKNQTTNLLALIELINKSNSYENYEQAFNVATISAIDFTPYYLFDEKEYTRNLLYSSPHCELILICWCPGQQSAIHDHAASECMMCCIDGVLLENHYQKNPDVKNSGVKNNDVNNAHANNNGEKFSALICTEQKTLRPHDISRINDDIALHEIANGHAGQSISLHLYIPSITACQVYEKNSPKTTPVNIYFHCKWALVDNSA